MNYHIKKLMLIFSISFAVSSVHAQTFYVNTTADTDDGACQALTANDDCTLREAINAANTLNGHDTILFNIPSSDSGCAIPAGDVDTICSIVVSGNLGPLPAITKPVTIDGSIKESRLNVPGSVLEPTQAASERPGVEIAGYELIPGVTINAFAAGITLDNVSDSVIKGLIVNRFSCTINFLFCTGIIGLGGSNNTIVGNYVGTDVTGTRVECDPVHDGGCVDNGFGPSNGFGNTAGILVQVGDNNSRAENYHIGGLNKNERNVVGNNREAGIFLLSTLGMHVSGNFVGSDVYGLNPLPQLQEGIDLNAFFIFGKSSEKNRVEGNMCVGTTDNSPSGSRYCIRVSGGFLDLFGDVKPLNAFDNVIVHNLVGLNFYGDPIPNGGAGIGLFENAVNNKIGFDIKNGLIIPMPNIIAYNMDAGVLASSRTSVAGVPVEGFSSNNAILFNQIHDNGLIDPPVRITSLGIDLGINAFGGDGLTPNDPKDVDKGSNNFQNFPEIVWAKEWQGKIRVHGHLHSEPLKQYRIDFYANDAPDASGYGEGERYIGAIEMVETNGGGNSVIDTKNEFEFEVELGGTVNLGDYVTATATELIPDGNGGLKPGSTSEFSFAVKVTQ